MVTSKAEAPAGKPAGASALQSMPLSERSEVVGRQEFAGQLVYLGLSVTSELGGKISPF